MNSQCLAALLGFLLLGLAPGKTIPNHAIADLVLGQARFTTNAGPNPPDSFSLLTPSAVAVDPVSRKVFVCDLGNSRILRYPTAGSLANGAGAEAIFGQARFSSSGAGSGDLGMDSPQGLCLDRRGRLWVADSGNNRVLMFEAAATRNTQYPDKVYGQPDFATNTGGTSASKMLRPKTVAIDRNDRLWVTDYSNNRVLRFDAITTKPSGAAADGVLGQVDFISASLTLGPSGLPAPVGLTVSAAGALYVGCGEFNRVLRFNNAANLANGGAASAVFGQSDFFSASSGLSATRLFFPYGVWITPDDSLWVGDYLNCRCLRFDHASTRSSGAAANGVVGQPDFTTKTPNLSNRGFSSPFFQPCVDAGGNLWVTDYFSNRVLRFPPDVTRPKLRVTSSVPKSTSNGTLTIQGKANDAYGISKIIYKVNSGGTKTANGKTSWKFKAALTGGNNTITITAVDSVGNKSSSKVLSIERR